MLKKSTLGDRGGCGFYLEVCVPELVLDETRQEETGHHFPNWWYREKTNLFWSRCSRKSRKNLGNKRDRTGLLCTIRKSLKQYRILRLFPKNLFKNGTRREKYWQVLNLINKSVPVGKFLMSAKIKFINFNLGSVREFPKVSRTKLRPGRSQYRMPVLSRDWEEDVPECSGREISQIFPGNFRSPQMPFGNADL